MPSRQRSPHSSRAGVFVDALFPCFLQILKPAEKKKTFAYGGAGQGRPVTPPRKAKGGKTK